MILLFGLVCFMVSYVSVFGEGEEVYCCVLLLNEWGLSSEVLFLMVDFVKQYFDIFCYCFDYVVVVSVSGEYVLILVIIDEFLVVQVFCYVFDVFFCLVIVVLNVVWVESFYVLMICCFGGEVVLDVWFCNLYLQVGWYDEVLVFLVSLFGCYLQCWDVFDLWVYILW